MTVFLLLACAGSPTDTASTPDSSDTADTTDTADSEASDLPPSLSADADSLWGAVGQDLALRVTVDDEDPGSVTLTAELDHDLATHALDGAVWSGTATAWGTTTLRVTATDAGGQSSVLELPLNVWTPRTWRGFVPFQSVNEDYPSPCIGLGLDGWTYVAGWTGDVAMMLGMDPGGDGWMQSFSDGVEHGRCAALDQSNGHALYVGERYPSAHGVLRSVEPDGVVWEADAPWAGTTAYWVDARDGVAAVAGAYGNDADGTRGGWAQLYATADGAPMGDPIVLSTTPRSIRAEPSSVQVMQDGAVLTGSWGYWDWTQDTSTTVRTGWVQVSAPGDVNGDPLILLQVPDANVQLHDALELSDGRIAVVGDTDGALVSAPTQVLEGYLMVFEADGTLAWAVQDHDRSMRFMNLAEGPDGRIYVAADGGLFQDWLGVLAFEADGSRVWESAVLTQGESVARGVAVQGTDVILSAAFRSGLEGHGIVSMGGADGVVVRLDTDGDLQL